MSIVKTFQQCVQSGVMVYAGLHQVCPAREEEFHSIEKVAEQKDQIYGPENQTQATTQATSAFGGAILVKASATNRGPLQVSRTIITQPQIV